MASSRHAAQTDSARAVRSRPHFTANLPIPILLFLALALILAQLAPTAHAAGTTYYLDCSAGNDGNAGTSTGQAWKSLAKAQRANVTPGDSVLLKRGCTWTEPFNLNWSGSSSAPILVGAYGSGELPKIQNAYDPSWPHIPNVVIRGDYLIVENIHTRSDPSGRDSACQNAPVGLKIGFKMMDGSSYITLRSVRATEQHFGVHISADSHHNKVLNSVFRDNRLADPNPSSDAGAVAINLFGDDNEIAYNDISGSSTCSVRHGVDGSAVEVYGGRRNLIHHNRSTNNQTFTEVGVTRAVDNTFAYNVVTSSLPRTNFLITKGHNNSHGPVFRTRAYNNTVYLTSSDAYAVQCNGGCARDILTLKNNIIWSEDRVGYADAAFDEANNIYWKSNGNPTIWFPISSTSKKADPRWVNRGGSDFHLASNSPAIDAGTLESSIAGLGDFDKRAVPSGAGVDIGAFEYGSGGGTPPATPSPTPPAKTELVQNGSFENTGAGWLTPWQFKVKSGAAATIQQASSTQAGSYAARIAVTQRASPWYVQLEQGGIALENGRSYTLSFWARADSNRPIAVAGQQAGSPYTVRFEQRFNLTTSWQRYTYNYTAPVTDGDIALRFNVAEATGQVWIDGVSFTRN